MLQSKYSKKIAKIEGSKKDLEMEENQRLEYGAPETVVFDVQPESELLRHSHQHDAQSEWES